MSRRLQVVMGDEEYAGIEAIARRRGEPVSVWVRQALRDARNREARVNADRRMAALRTALTHEFPTDDIEQDLEETDRGHRS